MERYKSSLVARGFTHRSGVNFFETVSPVVGSDTVRTVVATSASKGWNVRALYFKHAYFNVQLSEEIRMEPPRGRVFPACKAIFGLRQSTMERWKELRERIVGSGWESSVHDECMYYHRGSDRRIRRANNVRRRVITGGKSSAVLSNTYLFISILVLRLLP